MGFNNDGVDALVDRLKSRKNPDCIIGGNIGKNKVTPNNEAESDYKICFHKLFPFVDYFVVNVSSPNTPGLRELQEKEPLRALLQLLQDENLATGSPKPILLKIAPDLTNEQLDDIIEIVEATDLSGVIATNTTIERNGLKEDAQEILDIGNGGLSGQPLKERATHVIRYLHKKSNGAFPIIGVGGIQNPQDALEKLKAGASLVQIYSGMIYEGPGIVKRINKYLVDKF
jgi:dihydroorotate dehydrogenase